MVADWIGGRNGDVRGRCEGAAGRVEGDGRAACIGQHLGIGADQKKIIDHRDFAAKRNGLQQRAVRSAKDERFGGWRSDQQFVGNDGCCIVGGEGRSSSRP